VKQQKNKSRKKEKGNKGASVFIFLPAIQPFDFPFSNAHAAAHQRSRTKAPASLQCIFACAAFKAFPLSKTFLFPFA